jgi:hypothetical protein
MEEIRQRYADGELEEVEPLRSREIAAVLSDRAQMVSSRTSWLSVSISGWHVSASCSKSELVSEPDGFSVDTSQLEMVASKR